ncbi:MAG TPA: carboxypeptidase regulatory-like domain-containing protein, partial [Steroidobacteraceae bacterium]|nr:carboxypeptidase regulatory-like domain-containing protein [Steroidobacteraceae bacterium]
KLGVWPDAYYMTTNQFTNAGPFHGAGFFAFDRAKMLAGDPTAALLYTSMTEGCPACAIGGVLPSDLDGLTPPPAGAPNVFAMFLATEFADPLDGLRLWNVSANFDTMTLTIADRAESPVAVAAFDPRSPTGRADIEQPPPALSTHALDSISDRLLYRLAYRNFGTHQSLVVNHTVNVGTGLTVSTHQAGVRYYELRSSGGAYSVNEQATFAPDTDNRWMGSAAQDNQGNLAVGYSVSSLTTFPSIRYAGRLATDPANGLFQGEATLVAGTGVQLSTDNRWGAYSRMAIDPTDDCTFWYTNEYYTAASQATSPSGWLTHIGNFKFAECTPVAKGSLALTVTNCLTGEPFAGARVSIGGTFYGVTNAAGQFNATLAPGTYTVSVQSPGFGTVTGTATVTNGDTATLTLCLSGAPVLGSVEATLTGESCAPANVAPDPGERVTYDLTLANSGLGSTSNLVVTLLPGPGVNAPSAPQSYGVMPPGTSARRPFSFTTNGACGTFVTATVRLTDGSVDHGTRTFTFALGPTEAGPGASENFDSVAAPVLPAGWTASRTGGSAAIDWATTTALSVSAPNSVATGSVASVATTALTSPVFTVGDAGGTVAFRNNFFFQPTFDGGVLEISINGGPFTEWIAAGGSFISGGYFGTINASFGSPIAGRPAWTGQSGGFLQTRARLPLAAAGQQVQLRWLAAYDESVSFVNAGWRIDDVVVESRRFVCSQTCADVRITTSAALVRLNASTVQATITVSNTGATTALNAQLTQARLGAANGVPIPQSLGNIPAGGSATAVVNFTGVPAGASSLTVAGTHDGGTFSGAQRIVVP